MFCFICCEYWFLLEVEAQHHYDVQPDPHIKNWLDTDKHAISRSFLEQRPKVWNLVCFCILVLVER